jgi:omega-hydroxy-beta-dihydromenaquinone-9 sulfotransferase
LRKRNRSAPAALRGGQTLSAWVEAGGPPQRNVKFRGLQHRWFGFWFERYADITARKCASVALPDNPVFIVGLWRTGSSTLHKTLCDATGWTTPRTWQCFHPADFVLTSPPANQQVVRPMDAGLIDTFSPQEDEFAALLLGETSTYRGFIDPRRFDELEVLLDEWRTCDKAVKPALSARWETFLRAVLSDAPGRLLLKSPTHTFRLPWLAGRFPRARFIWLTRPIPDVLASNRRMWAAMVERYGHWPLDAGKLDNFLQRAIQNHNEILDWARSSIPERLLIASFNEVVETPANLIARIVEFCNTEISAPKPQS